MSQALFTSMTGLNTAQQAINVVSNNVANINTTAYKCADARFATLFSNTLSAGNAPSATAGGTNPKQIGLGVRLEGITRNFREGSFLSTDNTNDSMISGAGYYTVMDASGNVFLTRDGSFTLDATGDMITATGLKVLGAAEKTSEEASQNPIHIPQSMSRAISGDPIVGDRHMADLNNAEFIAGKLNLTVTNGDGVFHDITIDISTDGTGDMDLNDTETLSTFINDLQTTVQDKINTAFAGEVAPKVTIKVSDHGTVTWEIEDTATEKSSLEINPSSTANVSSNFGFYRVTEDTVSESKNLSYVVSVDPAVSPDNMTSLSSYTIGSDGTIEATYDNGDKMTVYLDDANQFQFQYVTASGVYIYGDNNPDISAVTVNPNVCKPQSMVMQIATVTNEAGLVSQAGNLWTIGPDTGDVIYTMAGQMGTGDIVTGGLESSNVDLARELSNMIIAQRAINANSRVFGTASSVLETLSQLGR